MLLGTRISNTEPVAVRDADVVARYDATDPAYVVKDSSNRISALLDKSKRLTLDNELITNVADREFTSDTGFWFKEAGWTISNGLLSHISNPGFNSATFRANFLTVGKIYSIEINISSLSVGYLTIANGATPIAFINTVGIKKIYHIPLTKILSIYAQSGTICTIDSISVKEVLGNHITQTDTTKMPIHTYDNDTKEWFALFDGVDDYLKSLPFTLNQPTSIYSCLKQNSWQLGDRIFDGNVGNTMVLYQYLNFGAIRLYAGSELVDNNSLQIGQYANLHAIYNTHASKLKINNYTPTLGSVGISNGNGFTLGSNATGSLYFSHISVKEIIIKRISTDESDTIFNYFKNKHKVVY